jgi:hypothetical protein
MRVETLPDGTTIAQFTPTIVKIRHGGKIIFARVLSEDLSKSKKKNADFERESELIRQNKKTAAAKTKHKFKKAKWTHPNGHPRCKLCGSEESMDGMCSAE